MTYSSTAHVESFGGTVDDVIDGLHGKVPGHVLADGSQTMESSSNGNTSVAHFSNWSVDNTLITVFLPETFGDLKSKNKIELLHKFFLRKKLVFD